MRNIFRRLRGILLAILCCCFHAIYGQNDTIATSQATKDYTQFKEMGSAKQKELQLDSSTYYLKKSLAALKKMEQNALNEYYNSGILKNRISTNLFNSGETEASITWIKEAILDFQKYVEAVNDPAQKLEGRKKRLACIDNLGGYYRGIGENERGLDLVKYSYREKLKFLKEDDPNLAISRLIIGHISLIARDYKEAGEFTDKGLEHIDKIPFAHTYALMIRASIYENLGDMENAQKTYGACENIYRRDFTGTYSLIFLDALIEMSRFYSKIGQEEKAINLATEGYDFTKKTEFNNPRLTFNHILNVAQVHYNLENYSEALVHSNEALSYFSGSEIELDGALDSIQNEMYKPRALLISAKSSYALEEDKNKEFLMATLEGVQKALAIVDQQKTNVKTVEDVNTLLIDNSDIINFTKQLRWDLYQMTKDKQYVTDILSLHESALYTRIRSRLNLKTIAFANVPKEIIEREARLKDSVSVSLTELNDLDEFFHANTNWNNFLDSLKQTHPRYYQMRYASIEQPLDNLQENLPENTTVIRYFYIEEQLYAFVASKTESSLIPLSSESLSEKIALLGENQNDLTAMAPIYHDLYLQLWQPIKDKVNSEKVIIIPDGNLFNLSFETLTPQRITSFHELATNSLLAKYHISYNYSLLLLDKNRQIVDYRDNFIAFAPEFSDKMKEEYQIAIADSIDLDKTYLTLLPQPFSVSIAKEYSKRFNGSSFLNEKSTKQLFTSYAKEHKIIHIATHAESNNISPELSRLVFAKNTADENSMVDNYLYTYEIYNQNLSSNLAILTACETGKPTYQPGEGMISLAHAFNYAGSESILTSLWKIDEKSSTQIIGYFYENLKEGMPKDQALRQAKLNYIATAEGRTQSPQYWAGLVLMGNTTPVDLSSGTPLWVWFLAGFLLLLLVFFAFRRRR